MNKRQIAITSDPQASKYSVQDLTSIMELLRHPESGCPWDLEQTIQSLKPYVIEETYEVAQAIDDNDFTSLKDELGDLLFQIIFIARLAEEDGQFDFDDIVDHVSRKMIFRHPHVFGSDRAAGSDDVKDRIWERQKDMEKAARQQEGKPMPSALNGVPLALPALLRSAKIQKRAMRAGFKHTSMADVFAKLDEEYHEFLAADSDDAFGEELGDMLYTLVLCATWRGHNAEEALSQANEKFICRFQWVEKTLNESGQSMADQRVLKRL